jgi:multiple sugar transport system permease protein
MKSKRLTAERALWQLTALSMACLFTGPLLWVLTNSLRSVGLPPSHTFEWFPQPFAWWNYVEIFRIVPLGRQIANSFFVSVIGAGITLITASWAGFAMSQLPAAWQRRLVGLAIVLLMTPSAAVWLPRYVLFSWIGLIDTYAALVAPAAMGTKSLYALMFFWTFRRTPGEIFESARLDGAGALTIWRRVALPLALPTTLAVALLAFSHYWSDFVDPLLYLKSQSHYTLAVGLRMFQQMGAANWSLLLAAVVVMAAPVVIVYLAMQRFIPDDLGLKGVMKLQRLDGDGGTFR